MNMLRTALISAFLLQLAACATAPVAPRPPAPPAPAPSAPPPSALESLVDFAGSFAAMPAAAKAAECRKLKARAKSEPGGDGRLRLLLARTVAPACGEPGDYRSLLDAAAKASGEAGFKSFLIYQKAVLGRLSREIERQKTMEKRLTQVDVRERKAHRRLQSQEGELRGLQKKLEALKSIEQSLDEPTP